MSSGPHAAATASTASGVDLKTHMVPLGDALRHVRRESRQLASDSVFRGFVVILGTREVQQVLADSGLPVVVLGAVYPGIELPFVSPDQRRGGQLMAQRAVEAGFRKLVFLNREVWRPGDTLAFNGVLQAIQAAGLGRDSLSVCNFPPEQDGLTHAVDLLLTGLTDTTAIVCRGVHFLPEFVIKVAERRGLRVPEDIGVFCGDDVGLMIGKAKQDNQPYVLAARCTIDLEEIFAVVGRMLAQILDNQEPSPKHYLIPME